MSPLASVPKIYFEVTNRCNFRCEFCALSVSRRRPQHMPFSLFARGVDEIARRALTDTIGFHVLGEPLLYPRIVDALEYARQHALRTELTTNGSLLTRDRVASLIDAGLGLLTISLQLIGGDDLTWRGTSLPFRPYYDQVLAAVRAISRSGTRTDVEVSAMNTATHRVFDVDKPMRLAGGRPSLPEQLAPLVCDLREAAGRPVSPESVRRRLRRLPLGLPQLGRIRIDDHVLVRVMPFGDWGNAFTPRRVYRTHIGACGLAFRSLGVLSNGEVAICCADYDGQTSLGNLRDRPLSDMLQSETAIEVQEGFQRLRVIHPHCQRCLGSTNRAKALVKSAGSVLLSKWPGFRRGDTWIEFPLAVE